ncbi:unnamed protein product [Darwinula stevensoni]|uniref:Uncharacterized protein n=1 Tax=Darwinula stevensoni TaxID=69355 RepID=A0A7R8X9D1_9CRUS|nr:unnamed protein product [Darwinula stevensoni]CAG0889547.1 unnamed protein product [Darwinula stevensoni]
MIKMHYSSGLVGSAPSIPVPRNLLFSAANEKAALVWSPAAVSAAVSSDVLQSGTGKGASTSPSGSGQAQHHQSQSHHPSSSSAHNSNHGGPSAGPGGGGGGGGGGAGGLVHWMSVMAEHVHASPHHDVHYMWNGVETKMSSPEHHNPSIHKCCHRTVTEHEDLARENLFRPQPSVDQTRRVLESPIDRPTAGSNSVSEEGTSLPHSLYPGGHGGRPPSSGSSSSPPAPSSSASASGAVVVPQPIKGGSTGGGPPTANGTGRKYQCKMCPQECSGHASVPRNFAGVHDGISLLGILPASHERSHELNKSHELQVLLSHLRAPIQLISCENPSSW